MWSNPGQDPGGPAGVGPPQNPSSSQELSDLKDQYDQQQLLISQLKELLRKTEQTNVTQEKVEKYANTLTKMNERAKRSLVKKEGSRDVVDASKRIETPASEKINMLRQQLEQNKVKLAERGKNQKGLEEMVIQIKAQLDDSQNLINQTPLNLSLVDTKVETYTASSSSQELYNILLNKEKKISDMSARIQKLEANVLDLQENVKEKDSVIDARTKAITLMSENLSKKGKSTLDALDETKLQMRKMQENFVELEAQMKDENQRLVSELELKSSQVNGLQEANDFLQKTRQELLETISDLQKSEGATNLLNLNNRIKELEEINSNLQADFASDSDAKKRVSELEKIIEERDAQILEMKNAIDDLNVTKSAKVDFDIKLENEEVAKLKKQLDESNKNMIKVKAQHKSKIKELTKKIDGFKKMGDVNVEVLRLQDENSKLNQKVVELEEEKGALQLKMVESDSTKDSISVDHVNELERSVSELTKALSAKEDAIASLEKQIEVLNENLDSISHQQNVQVKSEITSIHLEEQLDKSESEKNELLKEKDVVLRENGELLERIEILKKEKQEVSLKLESYIQENIDLMDKLEKLSAEKVSSAESIEIVEGLTQQEKLELEAYQKNMNISSEIKNSNENLEENPELNESVHQLTEETTELLQRIELFTVERREVMEKMELLTQENNNLNLKLKEIENNRDVLAETYEQLQNEKELLDTRLENLEGQTSELEVKIDALESENKQLRRDIEASQEEKKKTHIISDLHSTTQLANENLLKEIEEYKTLVEIQKQEINELRVHLMQVDVLRGEKLSLEEKVTSVQAEYEKLLVDSKQHEKNDLVIAKQRITELEERIASNLSEIETYKSTLEENKTELSVSAKLVNDLQNHIRQKEEELTACKNEIAQLNSNLSDLNGAIAKLEEENEAKAKSDRSIEAMSMQLEGLKDLLDENIQQIGEYEQELQANSEIINQLQKEIKKLDNRIMETEQSLESKDDEIKTLLKEKEAKETEISNLQQHIAQLKEDFSKVCDDLKEKCHKLKAQIDTNTGSIEDIRTPLEQKINELEGKNKEQLEKIKKYAAGLKKKTAAYQELEQKYSEINEKWEIEHKEKESLKIEANKNSALESKVQSLLEQLNDLEKELMSVQNELETQVDGYNKLNAEFARFKEESSPKSELSKLQGQISQYSLQMEDQQNALKEYESKYQALTAENELLRSNANNHLNADLTQKDQTIARLTVELDNLRYNSETNSNALQMKIQELELFIETQDAELLKYRDRVNKLEEGLSYVEDRRQSLEHKAIELDAELKEKSDDYDKVSQTEDLLEQRLHALIAHDEIVEGRLKDALYENQELLKHNRALTHEVDVLKSKVHAVQERNSELKASSENLLMHEAENVQLKQIILNLESEKRHAKSEFENKLNKTKTEAEKYEVELQNQVESFNKERKALLEDCEKLNDRIKEYIEANEELEDYRRKYEEQESVIAENVSAREKLSEENKNYVSTIDELSARLKNVEALNVEVDNLLQQKNLEIEKYQRLPRKEPSFFTFNFDADTEVQQLQQQIKNLETQKAEGDLKLSETHRLLQCASDELEALKRAGVPRQEKEENGAELEFLRAERNRLLDENSSLQSDLGKLKPVEQAVEKTVENVILEAEQRVGDGAQAQNIAVFTWPQASTDPFEFIAGNNQGPNKNDVHVDLIENTQDDLLHKIKTLEYMLYNSEKEKEEALLQCHGLSSELTRLVYDRENNKKQVESQIIPESEACVTHDDLQQLQKLEFEETKEIKLGDNVDCNKPVAEDTMVAESAYLCYTDMPDTKAKPPEYKSDVPEDLFSQIIPPANAGMSASDRKELQSLEFEKCKPIKKPDETDHTIPVVEDKIRVKSAYLCYDPELGTPDDGLVELTASSALNSFGENDDGWGWGPEEAKLEQEHQEQVESDSHRTQFKVQINELEEKIHVLEQARERHLEQIKQSQFKSGKLIKKLKEFKVKNEELSSQLNNKKGDGFDDLNDTIQDELRLQIQNLEKKIKEINLELEKERLEKNNLLKRVDVLTAANERMVENKEKQDVEVMAWQQRNRELSAKLEQFEWGFDSPKHTKDIKCDDESDGNVKALQVQIKELQDQIQDLTLDNEELQALLEEQRDLRINAEKAKPVQTEVDYTTLLSERNNLQAQLSLVEEEKLRVEEEKLKLQEKIDYYEANEDELIKEKTEMTSIMAQSTEVNRDLTNKLQALQSEHSDLNQKYATVVQANMLTEELEQRNTLLQNELQKLLALKNDGVEESNLKVVELETKLASLQSEFEGEKAVVERLRFYLEEQSRSFEEEKVKETSNLRQQLDDKAKELQLLEEKASQEHSELEHKFSTTLQQLTEEWTQRVDQRGLDVAESWKLHLEARENEFMQVEQRLKKEIDELEEKYNGLVNENNELRKNVDAEIRNEVDRVSALQQQINDRQNYINELTRLVQEKQAVIERQQEEMAQLKAKAEEHESLVNNRIGSLQSELSEKERVIDELNKKVEGDNREAVIIQEELEKYKGFVKDLQQQISNKEGDSRKAIIIQEELERYKGIVNDLHQQISDKEGDNRKAILIQEELEKYKGIVDDLQRQISDKEGVNRQSLIIQDELEKYKSIVGDLQQQIADKEGLLLQNSQAMNNYNQELELHKKSLSSLAQNIKEKDVHIENLTRKLENYETQRKFDEGITNQQIHDYQQQLAANNNHLQQSYSQIEFLNQELANLAEIKAQLQAQEVEINQMEEREKILEIKSQEKTQELDALKRLLTQNESRYEEMLSIKDIDTENLRLHLQEQVNKNEALLKEKEEITRLQSELSAKSAECEEHQNKLQEQNILLDEENRQLVELREIIQEQVLKIDDLQKHLYEKSRDYDALIAEIDIPQKSRKDLQQKHVTFADETTTEKESLPLIEDLSEPVSRAELDLALYMLHQRDVRCEELTVELMQLLEERDTLQLRLSNALREKEELKGKYDLKADDSTEGEDVTSKDASPKALHKGKASDIILRATGTELAAEATEQDGSEYLTSKLSELKTIGYRKDKTIVDEQALRRIQQLSIMQQHRDEAAKLPAEAAARLVDASYTLSRDVQSPSKVLLNWLWGRSTPKVNNV